MNVKELIAEQPPEAIAAVLLNRLSIKAGNRERFIKRITKFIENLNGIKPVDTGHMILGIFYVDEDEEFLDACLYRKEELAAGIDPRSELAELESIEELTDEETERLAYARELPVCYGFLLSPWSEVLGYLVDVRNAQDVGAAQLCAAIIMEMTYFGFDEEQVDAERKKLDDSIQDIEKIHKLPEEEQKEHYISAEELFAECGLSEPTEEEERESHRRFCRQMLTNDLRTYRALKKYMPGSF